MYCKRCGVELPESFQYCSQCGTSTQKLPSRLSAKGTGKGLSRPRDDKKIAGVCSGIARYLGVDVTLIRILVTVLAIWPPGVGLIFYIVCWIVMPRDPILLPPPPASAQSRSLTVS